MRWRITSAVYTAIVMAYSQVPVHYSRNERWRVVVKQTYMTAYNTTSYYIDTTRYIFIYGVIKIYGWFPPGELLCNIRESKGRKKEREADDHPVVFFPFPTADVCLCVLHYKRRQPKTTTVLKQTSLKIFLPPRWKEEEEEREKRKLSFPGNNNNWRWVVARVRLFTATTENVVPKKETKQTRVSSK